MPALLHSEGLAGDRLRSRRGAFEVFISQLVLDEAAAGDPAAGGERLVALKDLPQLDITDDVAALAGALVRSLALPAKAATDAAHIALAAVQSGLRRICVESRSW